MIEFYLLILFAPLLNAMLANEIVAFSETPIIYIYMAVLS